MSPLHIYKVFKNIPEAYNTANLVVVHHKYVSYYNVLKSSMVCKLAWLSILEVSRYSIDIGVVVAEVSA